MNELNEQGNRIILVEGGYLGVTEDPKNLLNGIADQGWSVKSVAWKKNSFVAKATTENGQKAEAFGPTEADALAQLLVKVTQLNNLRLIEQRTAAIDDSWMILDNKMNEIAQEYAKAKYYDPKAALGFQQLANDSRARANSLRGQIEVEIVDNPAPYTDSQKLFDDVRRHQHLFVSKYQSNHPLWSVDDVINFRIVHLIMGYVNANAQFGWRGEIEASSSHAQFLSTEAKRALLTDRVGQMAYSFYSGGYHPKIAYLKDTEELIGLSDDNSWGIHPSQMAVPIEIPRFRNKSSYTPDPNKDWSPSDLDIYPPTFNAFMINDPLDIDSVVNNGKKIDTQWQNQVNEDGTPNYEAMKTAVENALKTVLLAPYKDLKSASMHSQDLGSIHSSNPIDHQSQLEKAADRWNEAHGEQTSNLLKANLINYIASLDSKSTPEEIESEANHILFDLVNDTEDRYLHDPKMSQKDRSTINQKVNKDVVKAVKSLLKESIDDNTDSKDHVVLASAIESGYPSWFASQLKSIGATTFHIDNITKAALEDLRDHDGSGHHFRSTVIDLHIPGLDAQAVSLAWLLLAPFSSDIITLDSHILSSLGIKGDVSLRDYYGLERQFRARMDASGYSHIPLGIAQWAMRDKLQHGGSHIDLSPFRVIDPTPYHLIDWNSIPSDIETDLKNDPGWIWWNDTEPFGKMVDDDYSSKYAPFNKSDSIPDKTASLYENKPLCYMATISKRDAKKIWEWVSSVEWPEGTRLENPDEYHITLYYSEDGWGDESNRIWIKQFETKNVPCVSKGTALFGKDKNVAVIEFDSQGLEDLALRIRKSAEGRDLKPTQFYQKDSPFKAHITVANDVSSLPKDKPYIYFRTETTALAIPLDEPRFSVQSSTAFLPETPWHIDENGQTIMGSPGQTIIQHLQQQYPDQDIRSLWNQDLETGKTNL